MKFYTNLNQLLLFLICSAFYSCKSDESIEIVTDMGSSPYPATLSDWLKNPLVQILLGSFVFIVILYVVKYALSMLKPSKGGAIEAVQEVIKGGGKWRK
jgi:hypothetical protein